MLRTFLTAALVWLMVLGTSVLAHLEDDEERVVTTCEEVIAIAEPLMPPDAYEQLLVLSESDCMTAFGGYSYGELINLLSKEAIYVSADEEGGITYVKRPERPEGLPRQSLSPEPDACPAISCEAWHGFPLLLVATVTQWIGFMVSVLSGLLYLMPT